MMHGANLMIQSYLGLNVNFEKCLFQQVAYRRLHKTNKKRDGVRDYVSSLMLTKVCRVF